ncbi:MAG TPA: hypothetical protein VMM84_06350 [Pyrinomonadaceae bacterium]|nr:hypothetical protein [Pyrinomonadaceae bacterium]
MKVRLPRIKDLQRCGLALFVGLLLTLANQSAVVAQPQPAKEPRVATQLDEYGILGGCDHSARLDNLAIFLQNDPKLKAFIITYGPEGKGLGTGRGILETIKNYLVSTRGIEESRLETLYGGRNSALNEPRTELWLVPLGVLPPELKKHQNDLATFRGKFATYSGWDSIEPGEALGPPFGNVTLAGLADLMNQQKSSIAYIVAYNGVDAAPGAWRRVGQLDEEYLKRRGVEPDRVKLIHGGRAKETEVQLWVLPADAPPPLTAVREPLPTHTVQIGEFNSYFFSDREAQRWAFNGFVDVLRESRDLRACVIVRLSSNSDELSASELLQDPELGFERVDLATLVQKWTAELAEKFKIGPDRFVVLFASPRDEFEGDRIETWIVPPGALLPDPNAPRADEESWEDDSEDNSDAPSASLK